LILRPIAIRQRAATCEVNAFVEATPISSPARVYNTESASRAAVLPTTLQIVRVFAFLDFASLCAARVSAVSPDWVIEMKRLPLSGWI
jgi:hypothetical protein